MTTAEKLVKIAENEIKVFEAGQKSEYDRLWDSYQDYGNRENYEYGFGNIFWLNDIFNPKYPMRPTHATGMFLNFRAEGDLTEMCTVDFSNSTSLTNLFAYAFNLTRIGVVDTTSAGALSSTFNSARSVIKIDKLILKNDGTQTFSNTFNQCYSLQDIVIEGTIGKSLDIHWSTKLSMESLASIVSALSDTVTGQSITLPTTARDTYDSATVGGRWDELVAEYPNWTFAYA